MTKKKEPKDFKVRLIKLDEERKNSIWYRLKDCKTREEKEQLVQESHELMYIFGFYRRAWKGYLSYEDNMRFRFLGLDLDAVQTQHS